MWNFYYSVSKLQPNTNTNNIRFWKITRIRIRVLFGFEKLPEYEYYLVLKNHPNTNTNITIRSQLFEYYSNTELFAHLWNALLQRGWIWILAQTSTKSKYLEAQTRFQNFLLAIINALLRPKLDPKPYCVSQTPQILGNHHRFWVDGLGEAGCYHPNRYLMLNSYYR